VLNWETAYATAFQIQTSTDAVTWTPVYSTTSGTGGTQTLAVNGTGRYIRMYGTARATGYG
jgi:beta-glucosidase